MLEPTTSKPEEFTTLKPEELAPTTSKTEELEPTTSKIEKLEPTTSKPEKLVPTTSEPETIEEEKAEPTTSKPEELEPTTSQPVELEPTISQPEKPEPTTSKPEKLEPTSPEEKTTRYSIVTTSIKNVNTEAILTTIPYHINLTSIASTGIKTPTTIIESIIKTTTIPDYEMAYVVLVGFSNFLKFTVYCTFYVHFRSIRGFLFAPSLTMNVQLIHNRLLRTLQSQKAKCEKTNDNLENAVYLCNVKADVSNVNSIKIEQVFDFCCNCRNFSCCL